MCIAIYKPAGIEIKESYLKESFLSNPDGAGFAYINTDDRGVQRLKIKKALTYGDFLEKFKKALKYAPNSPYLIHFRIKTHGLVDKANCHPFKIDKDHVFIHNGIISGVSYSKEKSDTRMFCEEILRGLPKGWFYNDSIEKLISNFIFNSKLVIMNIKGQVRIINENKGHWKEGCWFSNSSYIPIQRATVTGVGNKWYNPKTRVQGTSPAPKNKTVTKKAPIKDTVQSRGHFYDERSFVRCEQCGLICSISHMRGFLNMEDCTIFCRVCFDKEKIKQDELMEMSTQCIIDYFNDESLYSGETRPTVFYKWRNPWTTTISEEDIKMLDDILDSEEASQECYAHYRELH